VANTRVLALQRIETAKGPVQQTTFIQTAEAFSRLEDAVRADHSRMRDHALTREQMDSQRRSTDAGHALADAANKQTAALVRWTRWLAVATIVLAVATVVLVVVSARAGT